MTYRGEILERLAPGQSAPALVFLPDLTLWHEWHLRRGTLPKAAGEGLVDVARALGLPAWSVCRPWRMEWEGVQVVVEQTAQERIVRHVTPHGTLSARWTLGPDGDWWQVEYPVKQAEDLVAAQDAVAARRYRLDADCLEAAQAALGEDGVLAIELPMRPFSELLHVFLGWGEGLLLAFGQGSSAVNEMVTTLETRLRGLVQELAPLAGDVFLAPDNLDGQYVSPRLFRSYLAESYGATAEAAHAAGKPLMVHVGATVRRLLPLLAAAGVDGVEGIAGPPQGDATLSEARAAAGPGLTLWGGIPQDLLIDIHPWEAFEAGVREAARQAAALERVLIGVADRVPVNAMLDRLLAIPRLLG